MTWVCILDTGVRTRLQLSRAFREHAPAYPHVHAKTFYTGLFGVAISGVYADYVPEAEGLPIDPMPS